MYSHCTLANSFKAMTFSKIKIFSYLPNEPSVVAYLSGIITALYSYFVLGISANTFLFFLLVISDIFGLLSLLILRNRVVSFDNLGLTFVCISSLIWPLYLFSNIVDNVSIYKALLVYLTVVLGASFCLAQQGFLYWIPILVSACFVILNRGDIFSDELVIGSVLFSLYILLLMSNIKRSVMEMKAIRGNLQGELDRRIYFESVSQRDFLTGAGNRLRLYKIWPSLCSNSDVFFALLDIDYFKKINDIHGHDLGDSILKRFCQVISGQLGDGNEIIRLGGEEFLVVMSNCKGKEELRMFLKEISRLARLEFESTLDWDFTFSAGYGQFKSLTSVREVLKELDIALYKAKRSGRNCIIEALDE